MKKMGTSGQDPSPKGVMNAEGTLGDGASQVLLLLSGWAHLLHVSIMRKPLLQFMQTSFLDVAQIRYVHFGKAILISRSEFNQVSR